MHASPGKAGSSTLKRGLLYAVDTPPASRRNSRDSEQSYSSTTAAQGGRSPSIERSHADADEMARLYGGSESGPIRDEEADAGVVVPG
eukprot:CAMPEP_0198203626 /NCGR_PEP_ID=MMETSP1445-20131203/6934_1 /TAXON_ID=36898 /ORGANISM="Pyramimonas sp., Strain CCMP2087" /LENGTH=87 /DNA_ID=CAMNT_0043875091 /DNA_START=26 /DNA_END=290 /DNA_ORIENTATION=+